MLKFLVRQYKYLKSYMSRKLYANHRVISVTKYLTSSYPRG